MIYVYVFLASLLFFKIALTFRRKSKFFFWVFSGIAFFIPCYLASVRDITMGTDVKVYILPLFYGAGNFDSFFSYILYKSSSISDILYLLLSYVCRLICGDYSLLFFMITFLSMITIYVALLVDNDDNKCSFSEQNSSILLGMFIYFLFFYNSTFNMARQSIALAFIILGFAFLRKNDKKRCYFFVFISSLFHKTSLLTIPFIFLYNYIKDKNNFYKKNNYFEIFIITMSICFVILSPIILKILSGVSFLQNALKTYSIWGNIHEFNLSNTLFYVIIFLIISNSSKKLNNCINDYNYYRLISIISIILLQLGVVVKFMDRITFYIFYPLIFLVISKFNFKSRMPKKDLYLSVCVSLIFITYWIYWIIYLGYHGTYPFVFR